MSASSHTGRRALRSVRDVHARAPRFRGGLGRGYKDNVIYPHYRFISAWRQERHGQRHPGLSCSRQAGTSLRTCAYGTLSSAAGIEGRASCSRSNCHWWSHWMCREAAPPRRGTRRYTSSCTRKKLIPTVLKLRSYLRMDTSSSNIYYEGTSTIGHCIMIRLFFE